MNNSNNKPLTIRRALGLLLGLALLCLFVPNAHANAQLTRFQVVQQSNLMLHLDFDRAVKGVEVFSLSNPERLVIDLSGANIATELKLAPSQGALKSVRHGKQSGNKVRIVLDLKKIADPSYEAIARQGGQRIVVDTGIALNPSKAAVAQLVANKSADVQPVKPLPQKSIAKRKLRDVIVAIDAGHGGKDPGAIGQKKTREKDITLAVALKLYKRLNAQEGITAVLTRDKDVYVNLRERIRIARDKKADVFVSLHADAFTRKSAVGSSVYALSLKGASSEAAQLLADKENKVDALFGEVELGDFSGDLQSTLLDLAQNSTLDASLDMGSEVLTQLKKVGNVHKPNVETANFAVLRAPDIPSVLVEVAFLSNLGEEKKLQDKRFQETLAVAIQNGIVRYLNRRAPVGTRLAAARKNTE